MDKIEYVNGFLFSPDYKKIVLIRKKRPTWQQNKLNGIGGKIELNEKPEDAMKREFIEEAGVEINEWKHFGTLNGDNWTVYLYAATSEKYIDVTSKTDEGIEIHYVFDVPMLEVITNLKWIVPMAIESNNNVFADITYR